MRRDWSRRQTESVFSHIVRLGSICALLLRGPLVVMNSLSHGFLFFHTLAISIISSSVLRLLLDIEGSEIKSGDALSKSSARTLCQRVSGGEGGAVELQVPAEGISGPGHLSDRGRVDQLCVLDPLQPHSVGWRSKVKGRQIDNRCVGPSVMVGLARME